MSAINEETTSKLSVNSEPIEQLTAKIERLEQLVATLKPCYCKCHQTQGKLVRLLNCHCLKGIIRNPYEQIYITH